MPADFRQLWYGWTITMKSSTSKFLAWFAIAMVGTTAALADDRDLLVDVSDDPYIFILFDISGSMNWAPATDAFNPADGDDPNSKFYQAKSALYRVLTDPDLQGVRWGWSTYNHDNHRVYRKHYVYTPSTTPSWASDVPYLLPGQAKQFGDKCYDDADGNTNCDFNNADRPDDCNNPADLNDLEDLGEVLTFPALGDDPPPSSSWQHTEWIRHAGNRYRVRYRLRSGSMGDVPLRVRVNVQRRGCFGGPLQSWTQNLDFEPVYVVDNAGRPLSGPSSFLDWEIDNRTDTSGNPAGFWDVDDTAAGNTCGGWESNTDSGADQGAGASLTYPTQTDPAGRGAAFNRGDVIPLDWQDETVWGTSNRDLILQRLAPNTAVDPMAVPEFRVSPYFEDHPDTLFPTGNNNGHLALQSQYDGTPPMLPTGSTPIGASMNDIDTWLGSWFNVADGANGDPTLACRDVTLLILTDGDETCNSDPCSAATTLRTSKSVRTFVVGFGLEGGQGNTLTCIADNGGTGAIDHDGDGQPDGPGVLYPSNEEELVNALRDIVLSVRGGTRTFTGATAPLTQTNAADVSYLGGFDPVADAPFWPGRVDAYLKPLPLKEVDIDGTQRFVVDRDEVCGPGDDSRCRAWDAGEAILVQAATNPQTGNYNLGLGPDQRRVYWAQPTPGTYLAQRDDFDRPTSDADWDRLLKDLGICAESDPPASCSLLQPMRDEGIAALDFFHSLKTADDPTVPGGTIDYLLGDVFHSDPALLTPPSESIYFSLDLFGNPTGAGTDFCDIAPGGYRCFAAQHRFRRRVLIAGANDGQVHGFDAGTIDGTCDTSAPDLIIGDYTPGTGHEVFSFIPKGARRKLVSQSLSDQHQYTTDGPIRLGDVYIDAVLGDGIAQEWRTVAIAGMREGGTGVYALDVTQPDQLSLCGTTPNLPQPGAGYVPSCADVPCARDAGFAQAPFPNVLWEFEDTFECEAGTTPEGQCDDDANGLPDLAASWSTPSIGLIQVLNNGVLETRSVAVFGGGMDAVNKGASQTTGGNYVYMVDIETGRAIYKQQVSGSVPSPVALVDLNQDAFIDTAYVGTNTGLVYKIDLRFAQDLVDLPSGARRVTADAWKPFPVFDTVGEPVFFRPGVVFIASEGQYALAFGTGDREDLWADQPSPGRFYFLLDKATVNGIPRELRREDFTGPGAFLPLHRSDYQEIFPTDPQHTGADFVSHPTPGLRGGWYMTLDATERAIGNPFSLVGITVFSTFLPEEDLSGEGGLCRRLGASRTFVVESRSANALWDDPTDPDDRFDILPGFLTQVGLDTTGVFEDDSGPMGAGGPLEFAPELEEAVRLLQPKECRFIPGQVSPLEGLTAETVYAPHAPVPICIIQNSWMEF